MPNMPKKLQFFFLTLLLFFSTLSFLSAAKVTITTGSVGRDVEVLRQFLDLWEAETGHEAEIITMPASTTDQFGQYKIWLGAGNSDVDLYMSDVIWAPQLSQHFLDLSEVAREEAKEHFPSVIASQTVNGKLIALPFFTDAPMLYYRKDLLAEYGEEPPQTWRELRRIAKKIQDGERAKGNSSFHGFVFQANSYEGLTCNALEWIHSYGGGQIIEPNGDLSVNNPKAARALNMIRGFIGTITPEGVLSYQEEEARGVWQTGNALFMRNWPYAYSLGNGEDSPIKGKIGVVPLPKGEGPGSKSAATLGGWNFAVSAYTKNKEAAIDLAKFLASKRVQKLNAIQGSKFPTIPSLYEDPDVLAVAPFFPTMLTVLQNSVARPSGPTKRKYNEVSKEFWTATHSVLSGNQTASASLRNLEKRLERVRGRSW